MRRIIALAMLAGCASGGADGWTKPGMTEEQLGRDTLQCLSHAQQVVPERDGPRTTINQDRYRQCMEALGYTAAPRK